MNALLISPLLRKEHAAMKIAIIYHSSHHENTKKLLDAIAAEAEVELIEASKKGKTDLSEYDLIGFASGIYYSKMHDDVIKFAQSNLPKNKRCFILYTCGSIRKGYTDTLRGLMERRKCSIEGEYGCLGYDTFGPFKLIGGIAKGHPSEKDIAGAVRMFKRVAFMEDSPAE